MTIAQIEAFIGVPLPLVLIPAATLLLGAWIERILGSRVRRAQWRMRNGPRVASIGGAAERRERRDDGHAASEQVFDAAGQLRAVERATFKRRRLLNKGEARLLRVLEDACAAVAPDWRVMAQVSLGEILASPDEAAYRAINSKRVDLLLIGPDGHALHAIELQGSGHHLGPAATRDAVKKEALRRAGIGYLEIVSGDTPADVRNLVFKLARRERELHPHSNPAVH